MKSIIMIGGGVQAVPAVQRIQKLGYNVIVTDRNPDAPAFKKADIRLAVDATDVKTIIAWVLKNKKKYNISGMFTLTNQAATVSIVSNITNLPSLPADTAIASDNKLLMKMAFKRNNIPTADFIIAYNIEEVVSFYEKNGCENLYIKAADGFGGKGVRKVERKSDFLEAFNSIREFSNFPEVLVEKELEGQFVDAQGIFYNNIFYPAGMDDAYFTKIEDGKTQYNPIETFNVSPSQQSDKVIEEINILLERSARSLGIVWGPVGGDFIISDDGIKVIEIGPRLHGPNGTLQIFPAATGIQPLEFLAQCVAGDIPDVDFLKPKHKRVAACRVFVSGKNKIRTVYFKSDPTNIEGIFKSFVYHNGKKAIVQSPASVSGLAAVFFSGDSFDEISVIDKQVKDLLVID